NMALISRPRAGRGREIGSGESAAGWGALSGAAAPVGCGRSALMGSCAARRCDRRLKKPIRRRSGRRDICKRHGIRHVFFFVAYPLPAAWFVLMEGPDTRMGD